MSPTPLGAAQGRGPGQGRWGRCCAHTPPTYVLGSTSCHSWNEVKALPPTSPLPSTESPVCSSQEKSCACKLSELKTTGSRAPQTFHDPGAGMPCRASMGTKCLESQLRAIGLDLHSSPKRDELRVMIHISNASTWGTKRKNWSSKLAWTTQ